MTAGRAVVFGAPRSGTTFLMDALGTVPELECVNGNLLPVGIAHLAAQNLDDRVGETLERSFRGALADYLDSGAYNSRAAALRKWWTASRHPMSLRGAANGVRGERLLVYKEPFLAFAPGFVRRALPEARLLYIFRDGRDVANSLVRSYDVLTDEKLASLETNEMPIGRQVGDRYVPWWVPQEEDTDFLAASPYVRAVWMWREMVRRCQSFFDEQELAGAGPVLRIRYEDLVRDSLREAQRIVEHLGVGLAPRTREQLKSAHPKSIGSYRHREEAEILAAEQIAGAELEALGYSSSASR